MTRERRSQLITVAVLAAALGVVLGQRYGWTLPKTLPAAAARFDPKPQDTIYSMHDAARAGDIQAYLASYTGAMEVSLRQALSESGEAAFAKYLRESNAAIKGIAINQPQPLTDREMKVRVEYVYQDRNEAQAVYLERTGAGWKIKRADGMERVKTIVPYATPIQ
jgi:hypothetical protein